LGQVSRIHVEVDFSGEPLFANFAEEGGDEAEQGGFVWKEGGDAGSAFEFLIDALDGVACAHATLVGSGEGEDGEALGDIFLHPGGKFRGRLGVGLHQGFEAGLGGGEIWAVEDGTDIVRHAGAHVETGGRKPVRFAGDGTGIVARERRGRRQHGRQRGRNGHR